MCLRLGVIKKMHFGAKYNKQSAQAFSGLLISQGKRELGEGVGVLQPRNPGRPWASTPMSGNKMEKLEHFFFLMGKQPSWVSCSQLTLTTPPELLTQCQGQRETLKIIAAAMFCPEATSFFFFPSVLSLFCLIHFQKW